MLYARTTSGMTITIQKDGSSPKSPLHLTELVPVGLEGKRFPMDMKLQDWAWYPDCLSECFILIGYSLSDEAEGMTEIHFARRIFIIESFWRSA